ncbi:MAG: hypothetical protein OXC37_02655 [Bdellovibrionaceae bacterium]|nr:hypothetical protein [Pseudobdellovibrionaceae bacterium]
MSYNFYSILHFSSITALSLILGALWTLYIYKDYNKKTRRLLLSFHGITMFLIFLAGFGLIAKLKIAWPWPFWIYAKLILWLFLAITPIFLKKSGQKFRSSSRHFLSLALIFILIFLAILFVKFK